MNIKIPESRDETIVREVGRNSDFLEYTIEENARLILVLIYSHAVSADVSTRIRLTGRGAQAVVIGLVMGRGSNRIVFHTEQLHEAPETTSNLLVKAVLKEHAQFTYDGVIRVERAAQKSDAYQRNENLLLSDEAHARSEPSLEILANDVRCTHGATIGTLDEEQLFYLASRGIREKQARRLIVKGFFEHAIGRLSDTVVKETIHKKLWQII